MASSSQPNYPSSFTDLLNQSGTPQTPMFCTQPPTFGIETIYIPDVDASTPGTNREARRRWTIPEDGALVSAWLNTSKDCIVGNDQRVDAFCKRVTRFYSACSVVEDLPLRKWNNCKQRWAKINEGVQKFCGCFDQAGRQATSGQSPDDVFERAYKLYFQDQKTNFVLEHAWRMLKNDQKWCPLSKEKGKPQSKRAPPDAPRAHPDAPIADSQTEEVVEERPIGVKAAKAAKAGKLKKGTRR
uniref:Glutathione S-transferase T3 n=1 Tax=Noccaea caerulescens TaxID=107243 RepID=A0A1J3DCA4_NOCCA